MLLEDPHNNIKSSGDWCYVTTLVVTTITTILSQQHDDKTSSSHEHCYTKEDVLSQNSQHAPRNLDPIQTAMCLDMLSALLSVLPHAYNLLGASVTGLVRILATLSTSPSSAASSSAPSGLGSTVQIGEVLQMLLKGCQSPEWLPIVTFGNDELDKLYKKFTSLPLKSQVFQLLNL